MRSTCQASSAVLAGSFFAIVMLAGCSSSQAPPAPPPTPDVQVRSAGWGYGDSRDGKTAGIDYAGVLYWTWDGAVALAVWIDHDAQTKGGLEFTSGKAANLRGTLLSREGKPLVEVACTTADGKAGRLTVGGQELDLAGGWLVLVSTAGEQVRVKQLKRDTLPDPNGNPAPFQAMKGQPEIAAFFAPKSK